MRIFHFLPSLDHSVGGPARAVIDLCSALASRGHEVTLATSVAGQAPERWRDEHAGEPHLIVLPRPSLPAFTFKNSEITRVKQILPSQDVVHLHGIWEFGNVQVARVASSHGTPYVISPRGMLADWSLRQRPRKKRLYLLAFGKRWLADAARVHLTADGERAQAMKWFPPHRGIVIPNLLDLGAFESLPDPGLAESCLAESRSSAIPGRPNVLFLSRIHPKKGLDVLLHACAALKMRGTPVSLVIAGDGDPQYISSMRALAADLGLSSSEASFVGPITGAEKLALYQACDLMALPTQQENFGFVFIEALACGLPIVTTRDIDLHAELQRSGAVTIVDRTADAFADAIGSLLKQKEHLRDCGIRARAWTFEVFDKAAIAASFESMYSLIVAERRTLAEC